MRGGFVRTRPSLLTCLPPLPGEFANQEAADDQQDARPKHSESHATARAEKEAPYPGQHARNPATAEATAPEPQEGSVLDSQGKEKGLIDCPEAQEPSQHCEGGALVAHVLRDGVSRCPCISIQPRYMLCCLLCLEGSETALSRGPNA
jgi:hypothetical protein